MNDKSWHQRLFGGFRRTSDRLSENLTGIFAKAALDEQTLDEIEEALIMSDLGPAMATRIRDRLAEGRFNKELTEEYLRAIVAEEKIGRASCRERVGQEVEITGVGG